MIGSSHSLFAVAAVAAVAAAVACAAPAGDLQRARDLYRRGQHRAAERAADRELARTPEHPEAWRLKINAAIRAGENARGVDLYMAWHRLRRHYDDVALRSMAESTLFGALGDADPEVRLEAIDAIERMGVRGLEEDVAALADDDNARVAAAAVLARADEGLLPRARELLASPDAEVRVRAIGWLRDRRIGRAEILSALADPAPKVRRAALGALRGKVKRDERARVLDIARADPDGAVRAAALRALGSDEGADILALARAALRDDHLGARLAGLAIIARDGEREQPLLQELARSSDAFVALRANLALKKHGGQISVQALQLALAHAQWSVRVAALNAVAELLAPGEALSMLEQNVRDPHIEVRLAAARVLMRLGQRGRARAIFVAALDDPRDHARLEAAMDLMRMDDPAAGDALARLARSPNASTRRRAAEAHRLGDNPTLTLIQAMGDPAAEVRIAAASALLALL